MADAAAGQEFPTILGPDAVFKGELSFDKGMRLMERGSEMPFAQRQVVTARNLTGGRWVGFIFGGLNYQIEHHLFPTMPRPNLVRAQEMVRAFCAENQLNYAEAGPIASFRQILLSLQLA